MKLSELLGQLGPDEYIVAAPLYVIYQKMENGREIFKRVVAAEDDVSLVSHPPSGQLKIMNIYVDSATGKVVAECDNIPVK